MTARFLFPSRTAAPPPAGGWLQTSRSASAPASSRKPQNSRASGKPMPHRSCPGGRSKTARTRRRRPRAPRAAFFWRSPAYCHRLIEFLEPALGEADQEPAIDLVPLLQVVFEEQKIGQRGREVVDL